MSEKKKPRPSASAMSRPASSPRGRLGSLLLIVAAVTAAYSNTFSGPFILDDIECIPNNPSIHHLWPLGPVLSPSSEGGRTVAGRPLVNLSLAVNYAISGTNVWSYHALNLLVHALATLTLWAIIRRTFRLAGMPARLRGSSDAIATAVTLLWALHPLNTQAVTYMIQRAESMMALFYLLTLYCVIRGSYSPGPALWYVGAIVAAAAGMATKEVMATAPLMVLLFDRAFLAASFRSAFRLRWRLHAGLSATWLILAALHGGRGASAGFGGPISTWEYAITQFRFVALYLKLSVWPRPLVLDYGTAVVTSLGRIWPQALLISVIVIATTIALVFKPRLGFLGAWLFIILAPSSSIVPVSTQTGAEHRMYMPLMAIVTAAVIIGDWVIRRGPGRMLAAANRPVAGILLVAVASTLLGIAAYRRNNDYRSWLTIWTDTIAKVPDNPRAYHNLALHYFAAGQFELAAEQSRRTVQIQPDYPDGYMNLGNSDAQLGHHEQAVDDFSRAIHFAPNKAANYFNRGNSLSALGRLEEAIADYNAAITRDAGHAQAFYGRGLAQRKLGHTDDALMSLSAALRVKPDFLDAISERALLYFLMKRYDDAWADVRTFERLGGVPNRGFIERLSHATSRPSN